MIHVLFVPGMFGSTVEYVLRSHTNEYTAIPAQILPDGSMHSFTKKAHNTNSSEFEDVLTSNDKTLITTPFYPSKKHKCHELVSVLLAHAGPLDPKVLIHAETLRDAELNMLFIYYKIVASSLTAGFESLVHNDINDLKQWNSSYTHWNQMKTWEFREFLSISYPCRVADWFGHTDHRDLFLKVKNVEFLQDTYSTLLKIVQHCRLSPKDSLKNFATEWRQAQQYVVDEFDLIDKLIQATLSNETFSWPKLSIVAEAIVQQRLRALKYNIRCDGLNIFPTDSKTLYNLLEKV